MNAAQPLHFPDRPLRVNPPGTGAAAGFGTLLWALLICAGIGWLVLPPVRDLIDDYSLSGSLQPVAHSSVEGRCSYWAGLIVRCDATLGAPAPGGGRYSRKVDYFFVEPLHTGDWTVTVVADPARPALLTTDLALAKLANRSWTLGILGPFFLFGALAALFGARGTLGDRRALKQALSDRVLRPVPLRMEHYAAGRWTLSAPDGSTRLWTVPGNARPIVLAPPQPLVLGVTPADGGGPAMPLDDGLRWLGLRRDERRLLLSDLGSKRELRARLRVLADLGPAQEAAKFTRSARRTALIGLLLALVGGAAAAVVWGGIVPGMSEQSGLYVPALVVMGVCGAIGGGLLLGSLGLVLRARAQTGLLR
ncbi:MAG TPA: hypothetical protein PLY77_08955 [Plasticicumulans sp.]|nr:hypothetical protein [Plasticicumulans sp.]